MLDKIFAPYLEEATRAIWLDGLRTGIIFTALAFVALHTLFNAGRSGKES